MSSRVKLSAPLIERKSHSAAKHSRILPFIAFKIANPVREFAKSTIARSEIYNNLLRTPSKRFWIGTSALNAGYIGSFLFFNAPTVASAFSEGHVAGGFLYAIAMASHSFAANQVVTSLSASVSRAFLKPQEKPEIPKTFEHPKVTIQIPCRNEPFDVVRGNALDSALKMSYPKDKLDIQVIDNSDPGKYTELEQFCIQKGVNFIHRDGTEGAKAKNLNIGLKTAKGDYTLILDSDNRTDPDFLTNLAFEITKDRSLAYVFSAVDFWNAKQNVFTKGLAAFNSLIGPMLYTIDNFGIAPFNGYGVLLDRGKLEEVGGWDENSVGEDYELSIRLLDRRYEGKRITHTTVHDALPANLSRYKIQQRRWAYGTSQNISKWTIKILRNADIAWEKKIDFLQRHSYYPGMAALATLPAAILMPLSLMSRISGDGNPENLVLWWAAAWMAATSIPFISYISSKTVGFNDITAKNMLYFIPSMLTTIGANIETFKGVASHLMGKKEGFRVTPKDKDYSVMSFFRTVKEHSNELVLGSAVMTASMMHLQGAEVCSFLGLGLLASPLISWVAEKQSHNANKTI